MTPCKCPGSYPQLPRPHSRERRILPLRPAPKTVSALRGRLTPFITDTMMGGANEFKNCSWPARAPPPVHQLIATDLKAISAKSLSMMVGAELAITLPETRRQNCYLFFVPLYIELERLLLSRKLTSYAVFGRVAPDLCRSAQVAQALLRRAMERAGLTTHPRLGQAHALVLAGSRGNSRNAGVAMLAAMAGVRTKRSYSCPFAVTDGTGIVLTLQRPAGAAKVTAAQAHRARRRRGGNGTKTGGGVTSLEHQAAVMELHLDGAVKKCVVGIDPGAVDIYMPYSLGLDADLVVVDSSPHLCAFQSERAWTVADYSLARGARAVSRLAAAVTTPAQAEANKAAEEARMAALPSLTTVDKCFRKKAKTLPSPAAGNDATAAVVGAAAASREARQIHANGSLPEGVGERFAAAGDAGGGSLVPAGKVAHSRRGQRSERKRQGPVETASRAARANLRKELREELA